MKRTGKIINGTKLMVIVCLSVIFFSSCGMPGIQSADDEDIYGTAESLINSVTDAVDQAGQSVLNAKDSIDELAPKVKEGIGKVYSEAEEGIRKTGE